MSKTALLKPKRRRPPKRNLTQLISEAFLIGYPSVSIGELLGVEASEVKAVRLAIREHGVSDFGPVWTHAGLPESRRLAANAAFLIEAHKVMPVFKMVDTCAGEFRILDALLLRHLRAGRRCSLDGRSWLRRVKCAGR